MGSLFPLRVTRKDFVFVTDGRLLQSVVAHSQSIHSAIDLMK